MKTEIDIAFVILHFMTDIDTAECIDSIKNNIDTDNYQIVVVDNASPNNSLYILKNKFEGDPNISFVSNPKNYGFAKGMNSGIYFINENWHARFIVISNNDILLLTQNLYSVLCKKYEKYNFAALGPMMITSDSKCSSNPMRSHLRTKEETYSLIKEEEKIIKLCDWHLYSIYSRLSHLIKHKSEPISHDIYLNDQLDYKLHGAFIVLSEEFFKKFNGLDESTFLYEEEEILYLHLLKNDLHSIYTPEIMIYHKEDSSTNEIFPKTRDKIKAVTKYEIESLNIYLEIYEKYETLSSIK